MFIQIFRDHPMATLITRQADGVVLEANVAFERLMQRPRNRLLGRTVQELGLWQSEQARQAFLEAIDPPSNLRTFEGAFRARSGEERLWRLFVEPCDLEGVPCLLTTLQDITEPRRIRERLEASEERFRTLVENVHEVIYMHDRSDVFTYLGPQTKDILGYTPEELTGKPWTSICPDSSVNRQAGELTAWALETGHPSPPYPVEVITKDGREILLEIRERPFRDDHGQIVGLVGSARDITEKEAAEASLKESQRRLSTLMDSLHGMVYRCLNDPGWTMEFVSRGSLALTGYPPEELVGDNAVSYGELIHPEDRERIWAKVQEAVGRAQPFQLQYRLRAASGQEKTVWEVGQGVFSEEGGLQALEGFIVDLTDRLAVEEALRQSETRNRLLLENAGLGIGYYDGDGKILLYNRVAASHMGGEPEDFTGKSLADLFGPEDAARYLERIRRAAEEHGSQEYEDQVTLPKGVKWFSSTYTGIRGEAGRLLGVQVISADITDRRHSEEALRQSEERFRFLFEHAPDAYYLADLEGKVLDINQAAEALIARPKEEVLGRSLMDMGLLTAGSERTVADLLARGTAEESLGPLEVEVNMADGSLGQVEIRVTPVEMDGELRILGVARDVTQRNLAEVALRESEERFRLLFENAPDAYYITNLEGVFLAGNRATERITGYPREELIGRNSLNAGLLDAKDASRAADILAWNAQGTTTGPDEFGLRRKDGTRVNVEILVAPLQLGGQPRLLGVARDVSERKQVEEALRESESRLRAVIDASPDITLVLDEDGRYVEILTSREDLLYASPDALRGKLQREVLPPEVTEVYEQAIRMALDTGEVQVVEYPLEVPQGLCWFEARIAPLALRVGEKRAVVSVIRDVTRQKVMGAVLEERASQLALVNETAQGLVGTLDLEGVLEHAARVIHGSFDYHQVCIFLREGDHMVLRANAGRFAEEMPAGHRLALGQGMVGTVGQTGEPLLANDVRLDPYFYNPLDHDRLQSAITLPISWAGEVIGALDVESEDLNAFDVNDAQVLDTLADQLAVAIRNARLYEELEAHSDSLERIVAERTGELRQSRDRVSAILDNSPDAVVFLGRGGTIERGNRAFENLFGYSAEVVVGQLPTMLLRPKDVPLLVEAIDRTVAESRPVRFEAVAEREDGKEFDVDVALGPIPGNGAVSGVVCSLRDISALKEVERMKDAFVSNVSHELRTPITSLRLNAGLLRMNPERQAVYVDRLQREVDRLSTLIEDLLRLSRLDQGRVTMALRPIDLNSLVAQYVGDRAPIAESRGLRMEFEALAGVRPVLGDPGMLGQVLSILLTNAVNYTPAGGTIRIQTTGRQAEGQDWVGLSVSDTGPGIALEEQSRIFERFFRGRAGRESGMPGTGLGLAIADEIVQRHHGRLSVQSSGVAGEGATITVWLPAVSADEGPADEATTPPTTGKSV